MFYETTNEWLRNYEFFTYLLIGVANNILQTILVEDVITEGDLARYDIEQL